jgi:hypothetical protein
LLISIVPWACFHPTVIAIEGLIAVFVVGGIVQEFNPPN